MINGIFFRTRFRTRAGCPWRDLPERFGNWKTVYNRHRRWMTGNQPDNGAGKQIVTDCGREPDPQYGITDRIAIALFPILEGRQDKEAGG